MSDDIRGQLQTTLSGSYTLERELGGGGMSRVFVAAETSLGRKVVIKVLSPDLAAGVSTERFRKEIQLCASLQHPHIVAVLAAGQADGTLYYTMPYIEGMSLRARLQQSGELPVIDAVNILRDVTRALAYAHRRGVAHRDIKPENIILSEDGAMVVDFGVAKALSASTSASDRDFSTGIGVALGTPAYMSPEQAAADPLTDQRSDIYSLGIVAYELLAGYAPFAGRPLSAILSAHATELPEPIGKVRAHVPPRLSMIVMQCLQKRPADRPQTAEAVLKELDAVEHALGLAQDASSGGALATRLRRSPLLAIAALVAVLVIAGGTFGVLARTERAGLATPSTSVVVMPFANIGESKSDESFSDGMTEELIAALGKVDGLRVKAAFSLKGSAQEVRDIGKQLDVQNVVAGSVRRSGDRLRVSARLVNVADGFQLWSDSFERELRNTGDMFRVQDEIALAIVNALKLKLSLAPRGVAPGSRQTTNLDAYKALLNGRYFLAKRTIDDIGTAMTFFEEAVKRDSMYALAWVGVADANALLSTYSFVNPSEVYARAQRAVERALGIDSTLAEGYATLGYVGLSHTWDWLSAERAFRRSIALNPNYSTSHHWYALFLNAMDRRGDALREIQRAIELDPVSLIINRELGRTYYYAGDNTRALEAYSRTLKLDPGFRSANVWIARAYIAQGKYQDAVNTLRGLPDYQGGHSSAVLAYAYARSGQLERATAVIEELRAHSRVENVWPMNLAIVHLALGHKDEALTLLEQDLERRSAHMAYLRVDPLFGELRGNDRFERILTKMHFPP